MRAQHCVRAWRKRAQGQAGCLLLKSGRGGGPRLYATEPGRQVRVRRIQRLADAGCEIEKAEQQNVGQGKSRAADEFAYELTDASIESWHLHWMCNHGYDSVDTMVGRLKNRMRQALNIGRIWTEGYYDSMCFDNATIHIRRRYIARHDGCRLTDGRIIDPR